MPAELRSLHAGAARRLLLHAGAAVRFQRAHTIRSTGGCPNGKFQNVSHPSVFFRIESNFFLTIYTGDVDAKNDGTEFWNSNSVIFENFFKFSKRCRTVPLRLIWTIMVAAKLDHSRVLVTKFHQNQSPLKGRSAGQRHTDRQTNSAENSGPSGSQLGQQTDTHIQTNSAENNGPQVCNQANDTHAHTHAQCAVIKEECLFTFRFSCAFV